MPDSGLVPASRGTLELADVLEGNSLLHGEEPDAFGDAGPQGVHKPPDAKDVAACGDARASAKNWTRKNDPIDVDRSSGKNQGQHPNQGIGTHPSGDQAAVG